MCGPALPLQAERCLEQHAEGCQARLRPRPALGLPPAGPSSAGPWRKRAPVLRCFRPNPASTARAVPVSDSMKPVLRAWEATCSAATARRDLNRCAARIASARVLPLATPAAGPGAWLSRPYEACELLSKRPSAALSRSSSWSSSLSSSCTPASAATVPARRASFESMPLA